jgi:hypothetical protein
VKRAPPKEVRREIFVLTPEEKRAVCFVLIAFLLGLATKHYRTAHSPPVKTEVKASAATASPSPRKRADPKRPKETSRPEKNIPRT